MPPALSSPGFLVALAVLLANDLWWKAAYHNWLTGKLSDFAGLFVVVVLLAAFRPARGPAIALITAATFTVWKSPLSEPLIAAWNSVGPYRIARVIDYTDLLALAVVPLARGYARAARPLTPPRTRYAIVALALFAILGTSRPLPDTVLSRTDGTEYVSFSSEPLRYDVRTPRDEVLARLARAGFKVEPGVLLHDVEIQSDVTCQPPADDRRLRSSLMALQSDGQDTSIFLRRLYLCRGDRPWNRDTAARVFESEVLERLGAWRRQA